MLANMEITVLKAKNQLSSLLRAAERGEEVVIRKGRKGGPAFRIVPVAEAGRRTLAPDRRWKGAIRYKDEDIWASEWEAEL